MPLSRRDMLRSMAAGFAVGPMGGMLRQGMPQSPAATPRPLQANGRVDWRAVRDLFPLRKDRTHFATFLFVSHPRPVADAIDRWRRKIDADTVWIEAAALSDREGRPFQAAKRALAEYVGGKPEEICFTSNTTGALAVAYMGLRVRADQEILTTDHDHYSHHESIRLAAARSQCSVRRVAMYETPSSATADQMTDRIARAIAPTTRAVGITWVHSGTGVRTPIAQIADAVARANRGRAAADRCLLVVDGVHGFGNQDVDVAKLGCDFFATGAHKWLFAPRGTGFLWGKADAWPELRPMIPSFDPDALGETWGPWMNGTEPPATTAAIASPGGFLAFEHFLAIPEAVKLHRTIGRQHIAARVAELNQQFREGAARMPKVTLHTPRDPSVASGINCFEVAGLTAEQVTERLAAKRFHTTNSPYRTSYARVSAGIVNFPEEVDAVLRAIRSLQVTP